MSEGPAQFSFASAALTNTQRKTWPYCRHWKSSSVVSCSQYFSIRSCQRKERNYNNLWMTKLIRKTEKPIKKQIQPFAVAGHVKNIFMQFFPTLVTHSRHSYLNMVSYFPQEITFLHFDLNTDLEKVSVINTHFLFNIYVICYVTLEKNVKIFLIQICTKDTLRNLTRAVALTFADNVKCEIHYNCQYRVHYSYLFDNICIQNI